MKPEESRNIARSQASRRVPALTAANRVPYTPQYEQAPGGSPNQWGMLRNGGFENRSYWVLNPSTAIITKGILEAVVGTAEIICAQAMPITEIGKVYAATYTVVVLTGGIRAGLGGATVAPHTTDGTYTDLITATTAAKLFELVADVAGFDGNIDNVSLVEVA
jgi:hypothetical protein